MLPSNAQRVAVVSKNGNAGASCITYADDFRVANRICQAGGQTRFVTAGQSPVVIGGLTPGGEYEFTVSAATASIVGPASPMSPEMFLLAPPAVELSTGAGGEPRRRRFLNQA